jgi:hypothetical protein
MGVKAATEQRTENTTNMVWMLTFYVVFSRAMVQTVWSKPLAGTANQCPHEGDAIGFMELSKEESQILTWRIPSRR